MTKADFLAEKLWGRPGLFKEAVGSEEMFGGCTKIDIRISTGKCNW